MDTPASPHTDHDTGFLRTMEATVRAALDAAPPARVGMEADGDGRMAFGLTAWRMPDAHGPQPCLVIATFGAIHGGTRARSVVRALRAIYGFAPNHILMERTAHVAFGTETAHHALARRAQAQPQPHATAGTDTPTT